MEAARQAGFLSVKAQPKASPKPARRSIGFWQTAIRSGLRNEPGFALPDCGASAEKPRFQSLFSAGPRTVFCRRPHPGNSVYFAPGLIAAKTVKPCDGGVFGALNSLLISEQKKSRKRAERQAGFRSAQAQPKPCTNLAQTQHKPSTNPAQTQPKPSPNPARTQPEPSPKSAQSQPKASASLDRLLADRHSLWFTQRTGLCFAQIAARLLQAAFSEPV